LKSCRPFFQKTEEATIPSKFVGVSGFDFVFSEDASPKKEIENLLYLISRKLGEISKDRETHTHKQKIKRLCGMACTTSLRKYSLGFEGKIDAIYRDRIW
jgi:hypothetical protein